MLGLHWRVCHIRIGEGGYLGTAFEGPVQKEKVGEGGILVLHRDILFKAEEKRDDILTANQQKIASKRKITLFSYNIAMPAVMHFPLWGWLFSD